MTLSDGTTTLTFTGTQVDDFQDVLTESVMAAGGRLKSQTSGRRFVVTEKVRCTGAQVLALMELLAGGADYLYYTPTQTPQHMSADDFPHKVIVDVPAKNSQARNGDNKIYYITLSMRGYELL